MKVWTVAALLVAPALGGCAVQVVSPYDAAIEARAAALHEELIGFELAMRRSAGTPEGDPRTEANRARFDGWQASVETMEALSAMLDTRRVDCRGVVAHSGQGIGGAAPATRSAPAGSDCQTIGIVRLAERLEQLRVLYDRECRVPLTGGSDDRRPRRAPVDTPRLPGCDAIWSPLPGAVDAGRHGLGVDAVLRSARAVLVVQEAKRP